MVEELRGLADQLADLARRNEALAMEVGTLRERQGGHEAQLAAKDQALAADALVIGELYRRAEAAEAERDRLAAAQAAQDGLGAPEAPTPDSPRGEASAGFWGRVRRVFGGGGT
jgi:regulator of replication initiation timing